MNIGFYLIGETKKLRLTYLYLCSFLSQKKKIFGFGSLHFSPLFGTSFSAFSTANFTKVTTQSNSNNSHESHLATPNQNNSSSSQPEQPLSLSVQYITKIKDHKQKGDYLGAVSIFEEMCSKGIKPDRFHYSIMIPIYTFLVSICFTELKFTTIFF
jgi:pentatricopeptide repeat protein